jgi:hypothetical protein
MLQRFMTDSRSMTNQRQAKEGSGWEWKLETLLLSVMFSLLSLCILFLVLIHLRLFWSLVQERLFHSHSTWYTRSYSFFRIFFLSWFFKWSWCKGYREQSNRNSLSFIRFHFNSSLFTTTSLQDQDTVSRSLHFSHFSGLSYFTYFLLLLGRCDCYYFLPSRHVHMDILLTPSIPCCISLRSSLCLCKPTFSQKKTVSVKTSDSETDFRCHRVH